MGRPVLAIANRGDIASRLIRGAHTTGMASVVLYSRRDVDSLPVRSADVMVALGTDEPTLAYLDAERVIAAASARAAALGAQVLHDDPVRLPGGVTSVQADLVASLWELEVSVGDVSAPGQIVAVLEAVKMEIPVAAEQGGTVRTVDVTPGQAVSAGQLLMTITKEDH